MTATIHYVGERNDEIGVEDEPKINIDALLDEHNYAIVNAEERYIKTVKCSDREVHEFELKIELGMFFDKTFACQYNGDTRKYRTEFVQALYQFIEEDAKTKD